MYTYSWRDIAEILSLEAPGSRLRVEKYQVPHPKNEGFRAGVGLPQGQRADFRFTLQDCTGLHVQDFDTHYEAHIDRTDPACDAMLHLRKDAPGTTVAGAALVGALLGGLLGRSSEAAMIGAVLGGAIGGASVAAAEHEPNPKKTS